MFFFNLNEARNAYPRSAGPLSLDKREGLEENGEYFEETNTQLTEEAKPVRKDHSKKRKIKTFSSL